MANAPERWLDGDEWQRIGDVYRLLGANTQAEYYFDKSVQQWGAGASLRAVEALVNVLAKGGAALAREGQTVKAGQSSSVPSSCCPDSRRSSRRRARCWP